jgi:hypothetical protein
LFGTEHVVKFVDVTKSNIHGTHHTRLGPWCMWNSG